MSMASASEVQSLTLLLALKGQVLSHGGKSIGLDPFSLVCLVFTLTGLAL